MGSLDSPPKPSCVVCGRSAQENGDGRAPVPVIDEDDLRRRLDVARAESLFQEHLRRVFGDGHAAFTPQLRGHLRELWMLALTSAMPTEREMTAAEEESALKFRVLKAREKRPDDVEVALYPEKVGKWSPEWPVSSRRDRTKAPCPECGGRGLGDYPHACNRCGGTGNA